MLNCNLESKKMEVLEIQNNDKQTWNNFVKKNGTLLQSWQWGNLKEKFGWKVYHFAVCENSKWLVCALILSFKLPFGKSFFYIPEGPVFDKEITEKNVLKAFDVLIKKIKELAQKEKAIFVRFEPFLQKDEPLSQKILDYFKEQKIIDSFEDMQPAHRLWIDLTKSETEILSQMKHKGRYNIKIAQKNKINIVKTNDDKMLDEFYTLYKETAKRDKFGLRPKNYFNELFNVLAPEKMADLYFAYFQKTLVASLFLTRFGKYATYLYGASSSKFREKMPAYLLQWEAIQKAKKDGFLIYDFAAIAPSEKPHKWSGLRDFKMKFGGSQIDFLGCYDLVLSKFWYNLFKIVEKTRRNE